MNTKRAAVLLVCSAVLGFGGIGVIPHAAAQTAASQSAASRMGTVKEVSASGLTLTISAGADIHVVPGDGARIVRTAPGQRTLAGATPIQLTDIQPGDRMLVRGSADANGKSFVASDLIVMKKTDIADKQARELEDWQKRGIGGRVTAVDAAAGTVTVSVGANGSAQAVTARVSPSTVVRRYALDSVKFNDATPSALDQIKVGDQLRARGTRSAAGTELTAEEIVAGTFHNIAGTVVSTDAANHAFTVKDLATKKPVVVKISGGSQMRKLPEMMAQMLAMQVKSKGQQAGKGPGPAMPAQRPAGFGPGAGARPNGGRMDINQMMSRLPAVTLAELNKGDAVMIVATQGNEDHVTAITMLSGVEPILTASPSDGAMLLSPWNLGGEGEMGGDMGGMGGMQGH